MSVLGTELRLRRWVWAAPGCVALAVLSAFTGDVAFPLPIALRLIKAPEVLALIAVVLATHPLVERLPQLSPTAVRERVLRPARAIVSLVLIAGSVAPGAATIPHLAGFGLGLWAVTVLVIIFGAGTLAWLVPVIGGMGLFLADGGIDAPVSSAIATTPGTWVVSSLVVVSMAGYALRLTQASRSAHG